MAKRIVIIEDDQNILELLVYLFEDEGFHVSPFLKGQSATEISLLSPNVILLDVSLIGSPKRGDEICTDLKALIATSCLPVILLSAEKNLHSIAKNCLADAFLCKPFNIDELLRKVNSLVA